MQSLQGEMLSRLGALHSLYLCPLIQNTKTGCDSNILKGIFWFQKSVCKVVFFGFNIILDHMRVHIPNIGSLAHS